MASVSATPPAHSAAQASAALRRSGVSRSAPQPRTRPGRHHSPLLGTSTPAALPWKLAGILSP